MNDYSVAWEKYRRWNRRGTVGLILAVVVLGAVVWLDESAERSILFSPAGYLIGTVGWSSLILWLYCFLRQSFFSCPRCEKQFQVIWSSAQLFQQPRCSHCKLPLYASA